MIRCQGPVCFFGAHHAQRHIVCEVKHCHFKTSKKNRADTGVVLHCLRPLARKTAKHLEPTRVAYAIPQCTLAVANKLEFARLRASPSARPIPNLSSQGSRFKKKEENRFENTMMGVGTVLTAMALYWPGPESSINRFVHDQPPSSELKRDTFLRAVALAGCVKYSVFPAASAANAEKTIGSGKSPANQPIGHVSPPSCECAM